MDFKRTVRIFMLAFGLLNLYLINGIVEREDIQNISSHPADSSVIGSMSSSNIEIPEDLSEAGLDETSVYSLQINAHDYLEQEMENSELHRGTLNEEGVYYTSFPSNPIDLEGNPTDGYTNADFEAIQSFVLSEEVMLGKEYTFNRFDQEGNRFLFYQEVDDIPIADGTSEISLFVNTEGDVISYQQTYAGPATRQGVSLTMISGTRAIEILFLNNEIRQGSKVELPILSYRRALHLEDLSMYSPFWNVVVEYASERNTFRVDAVNGTIIRQSSPVAPTPEENPDEEDEEVAELEEDVEENTES